MVVRVLGVVIVLIVVVALGVWGVTQVVANILPNGPIASFLGKHKPIKSIITHGGLPTIRPPSGTKCGTPGTGILPILGCRLRNGTPGPLPHPFGPGSGTPGSGPPIGPGSGPPGSGPPHG
jgi:hypothetical protein